MLSPQHRQFVDLLPLLLHLNHPALPGYVSQQAPCGISGWSPPAATLAMAARLSRSFTPQRRKPAETRIDAVYLMGSPGTLGHSDHSDLDIWVCYPHDLSAEALALLARKTTLLHQWAATLGLEAHLFLMNGDKFRSGEREPLTGENCGSTQHHLLLDEFYRTGILLAGRIPTWWLVPPEQEADHDTWCSQLLDRRYVPSRDVLDFGGLSGLSAGEFLGAGIWQLYKAIESPYKSLLKLLLFEVYASELPHVNSLSSDCKRAVCAGITDIDELDPYLLIYRRIEAYLQRQEQVERLEIVRRSLYYKVGKRLSLPPRGGKASWQRQLMKRLVADWGWDDAKLARLDARQRWNILEVAAERSELVRELRLSYRFLADFAGREGSTNPADAEELAVLGRRLHAAYETRAGKIAMLNPGQALDVSEAEVTISTSGDGETSRPRWVVRGASDGNRHTLHESECLSELLGWCLVNGVIDAATQVGLSPQVAGLREIEVRAMLRELQQFIAIEPPGNSHDEAFGQRALVTSRLVFVNVGTDPLQQSRASGVQRVSSRTDSLGYSALRENLVLNLETVSRTSWGELVCTRHDGLEGLLGCLGEHLQTADRDTRPRLLVRCFCPSRAQAIAARLAELFADLDRHLLRERNGCARYVLEIGNRLILLSFRHGASHAQDSTDIGGLYRLLGKPQPQWSPIAIDRHALGHESLRAIVAHARPWRCCVFIEKSGAHLWLTVSDENGSLWRNAYPAVHERGVLGALAHFLENTRRPHQDGTTTSTAVTWFRVQRLPGGSHGVEEIVLPVAAQQAPECIPIHALETPQHDRETFTLRCHGEHFLQYDPADAPPPRLCELLRRLHADTNLPVCVTAIEADKHGAAGKPTIAYLHSRSHIERSLTSILDK